ncbi:MAG: hypothetical protein KME21_04155 [Desmonostoc vinosum HA7617-LM4]|nr:hypothetical protein [Desmonostoc vinosum HA7617-LM4]
MAFLGLAFFVQPRVLEEWGLGSQSRAEASSVERTGVTGEDAKTQGRGESQMTIPNSQ